MNNYWSHLKFCVFMDILGVTLVSREDMVRLGLRSLLYELCRTSLARAGLAAFPLMINKNAIKIILMKSSDIRMGLNKHRCVLPRVWNSIHMFPFDPCYCSHWNTNPSDIPTTTWLGLPQGQRETLFASLHACISVFLCVCVCLFCQQRSVWFGSNDTLSARQCAPSW